MAAFGPCGPVRALPMMHPPTLRLFLSGALNDSECPGCGRALGVPPSMIVGFARTTGIAYVGPAMIGTIDQLIALAGQYTTVLKATDSLDELHRLVLDRLRPAVATARAINELPSAAVRDFVMDHRDDVAVDVFAVALADETPGRFGLSLRNLALAQAYHLFLLGSDDRDQPYASTLEQALQRAVFAGTVVPGAREALTALIGKAKGLGGLRAYAVDATLATACVALGEPNPRALPWARHYVGFQLQAMRSDRQFAPFRLAGERLRATLTEAALRTALAERDGEPAATIRAIAAEAGLPEAADLRVREHEPTPASRLVQESDAAGALRLYEQVDLAPEARADALIRLGQCLLDMLRPATAFRALGRSAPPWEADAGPVRRIHLHCLRAQAAFEADPSSAGERPIADALDAVRSLDPDRAHADEIMRFAAQRNNRAIGPEIVVETLRPIVERGEDLDPRTLLDFATALADAGDPAESLRWLDAAPPTQQSVALRARVLATSGRQAKAFHLLSDLGAEPAIGTRALFDLAAVLIALRQDDWPRPPGQPLVVLGLLNRAAEAAQEHGEWASAIRCWKWMGLLEEAFGLGEFAEYHWIQVGKTAQEHDFFADPEASAWLAMHRFAHGDDANGRALVNSLPLALAIRLGQVRDLAIGIRLADPITEPLDRAVAGLCARDDPPWRTVQVVADLRRGLIERAQTLHGRGLPPATRQLLNQHLNYAVLPPALAEWSARLGRIGEFVLLEDATLGCLAPATGVVVVVEWIEHPDGVVPLRTTITSSGRVTTTRLAPPEVDLPRLAGRISSRLANWWPGRAGDPLEVPDWAVVRSWFADRIGAALDGGAGHVVIIEPRRAPGLPWHVVGAGRWTCSYISSWSVLLDLASAAPRAPAESIGTVAVPRAHEDPEIIAAFAASGERSRQLTGYALVQLDGPAADRTAVNALMTRVDLAKLLCHGYVSGGESDVSLMLASDGGLPLVHVVAAASDAGRRHRYGWRDLQHLDKAPAVVCTAACDAGQSHDAPLGERLGIFRALRHAGTRSFVAPRWEALAARVIPIIDDTIELSASGERSLAEALAIASRRAEADSPPWIAWTLALEGDWR